MSGYTGRPGGGAWQAEDEMPRMSEGKKPKLEEKPVKPKRGAKQEVSSVTSTHHSSEAT